MNRFAVAFIAIGWIFLWMTLSVSVKRVLLIDLPHFQSRYAPSETLIALRELSREDRRRPHCTPLNCSRLPILPFFKMSSSECSQIIEDPLYARFASKHTVKVSDEVDALLDTSSCDAIFARSPYRVPPSETQKKFPIAFVRVVYKSYHMQELLLNLQYSAANEYCFALDAKASPLFQQQMRALANCFPNVRITERQFAVDSAGHNTSKSVLECLTTLLTIPRWKYAVILQNDDVPLKTPLEMAQILRALNGSNDVNVGRPNADRVPLGLDWSYRALNLFNDVRKNDDRVLGISKGSTGMSLSRAFVEFIVKDLNLSTLVDRFDSMDYGVDEMLFSSLHSDDQLQAPGGFTRKCIDTYNNLITRYVSWERSPVRHECLSGAYRHRICVFGLQDLRILRSTRALFANKMLPDYDYSAIACWARYLFQRTLHASAVNSERKSPPSLNLAYYRNRLPVRFHNDRQRWTQNMSALNCSA